MPNAHEGYVSWEKAETIRTMVRAMFLPAVIMAHRSIATPCSRASSAVAAAAQLTLRYSGAKHHIPRYSCSRGWMDNGRPRCIAFGGLRVDDAIEEALLTLVGPGAIAAAVTAEKEVSKRRAMRPTAPSGNMTPPIRPTGWWRANRRRAGTRRSRVLRRPKVR